MRALILSLLFVSALGVATHAVGETTGEIASEGQIVARIQTYLRGLGTLRAGFIQIAPGEPLAQGELFLKRPGRLRMDYNLPNPNLIIANGQVLAFFDRELRSRTVVDLADTLAYPLISDINALSDDYRVVRTQVSPDGLSATFISRTQPDQGQVTLLFAAQDDQLILEGWMILDANGQITQITLTQARHGDAMEERLFSIYDVFPGP